MLIDHLPSESATKTGMRDSMTTAELTRAVPKGHGPWSHTDFLLRALLDRLGWVIHAIYRAQGGNPHKPDPYPGPGVPSKHDPGQLEPRVAAYFARLRREHAQRQAKQETPGV